MRYCQENKKAPRLIVGSIRLDSIFLNQNNCFIFTSYIFHSICESTLTKDTVDNIISGKCFSDISYILNLFF